MFRLYLGGTIGLMFRKFFLLYKEMGKHSTTNKDWFVYLLPYGRGNGQPKVGVSSGPEARLWALVRKGIEVKGARIIDIIEDASRTEAEHIEMLWQIHYGAIENSYRMQNRRRSFRKNTGHEKYAGLFTAIALGSESVRV